MKTKRKINYAMLMQICKDIAAEPLRFDMDAPIFLRDHIAPCNTAACIAGFAVINHEISNSGVGWKVAGRRVQRRFPYMSGSSSIANWSKISPLAATILGLNANQGKRLFHEGNWPAQFQSESDDRRVLSGIAIKRIEHFIKTRGRE